MPRAAHPAQQLDSTGLLELPLGEPFYLPIGREVEIFLAAYQHRLPVMLKGPTGCGKTRFVRYMAWRLQRPLVTVACHDDLSANDLTGRFLVHGGETIWQDGPLLQQHGRELSAIWMRLSKHDRTPSWPSTPSPMTGVSCRWKSVGSLSRRTRTSSLWCPTTPATKIS